MILFCRRRSIYRRIRVGVRRCVWVAIIRRIGITIIRIGVETQSKSQSKSKIGPCIAITSSVAIAATVTRTAPVGIASMISRTTVKAIAAMVAAKPSSCPAVALGLARGCHKHEDSKQDDNFFHSVSVFCIRIAGCKLPLKVTKRVPDKMLIREGIASC